VRLVTWNILDGGAGRIDAIARVLRDADPDLVALQEANDRAGAAELASALEMALVYGEANSAYAVAWLTRLPLARSQNHRLAALDKTLLEVEVDGLRLFATHLSAGRAPEDEPRRIAEVAAILERIGGVDGVLVGDFNATHPGDATGAPPVEEDAPGGYVSRRPVELVLEHGFVDCFRTLHPDERGWTYTSEHPWARFDFVFARALRPRSCRVVGTTASDHFALVAELDNYSVTIQTSRT
jgi:endonuclease/exonuclease/phosphatase family metal-dependent hydrolase